MTKKDYIAFAKMFREMNPINVHKVSKEIFLEYHAELIARFMAICKADNPNFKEKTFISYITHGK